MKTLTTYQSFLYEKLRILKGPNDDEMFEMFKKLSPDEMFNTIFIKNLDDRFLDLAFDRLNRLPAEQVLDLTIRHHLGDRGFQKAVDKGILEELSPKNVLISAAKSGSLKYIKYALSKGANVNYKRYDGYSSIIYAIDFGFLEIVKFLIEKGADMDAIDNGWTPLLRAAYFGRIEIFKYLVEHGADINQVQASTGWTPLMYAARRNCYQLVKYLVELGADVTSKDNSGQNVFDIVRKGSKTDKYLSGIMDK